MKSSYLWAGLVAVAIGGWFAPGNLELLAQKKVEQKAQAETGKKPAAGATATKKETPFSVEARSFKVKMRQNALTVRGRTRVDKQVSILARTTGIVEQADFKEGDAIKAGNLLCRLDMRDRKARLAQAKAQLASTQRDYQAALKLHKKKYASTAKVATERARRDAALAAIEQIELEINYTNIKAPITGIVTSFQGEKGKFLQAGKSCAVISVFDPILVVIQVGEREINNIKPNQKATARLVTGAQIAGTVSHISPTADVATRTFKVEISVSNPDYKLRDGITAEVSLPLAPVKAHLIPAGVIGLDDNGQIGVRTIVDGNKVKFVAVKLVGQTRKGTWVQGLPDDVTIIIAGQDYVLSGQSVQVVMVADPAS